MPPDYQLNTDDEKLRGNIATNVLRYGTATLAIVATIIIIAGISLLFIANGNIDNTEKATNLITNVFHSLLPVIATWVGTVIAFYFGKANFEAASKSAQDFVKQISKSEEKLKGIKVSDKGVMRSFAEIIYNTAIAEKEDKDITVKKDLIDFIDTNPKGERLPVFSSKKIFRYVIHESTLNEFVRKLSDKKYTVLVEKAMDVITLEDLIKNTDEEMKNKLINSAAFISKNATLYEANEKIKANKYCQDVFVTENGIATEEVIGWITNNKVTEFSKL